MEDNKVRKKAIRTISFKTVYYLEATTPAEFGTLFDTSLWVGTVWVSRALSAQHPLMAANFG